MQPGIPCKSGAVPLLLPHEVNVHATVSLWRMGRHEWIIRGSQETAYLRQSISSRERGRQHYGTEHHTLIYYHTLFSVYDVTPSPLAGEGEDEG